VNGLGPPDVPAGTGVFGGLDVDLGGAVRIAVVATTRIVIGRAFAAASKSSAWIVPGIASGLPVNGH
jgi:hypothetical protein